MYFGDVCAGPGGFSEYVLWRRRWHAKGFGMTLKGANDFKLEDFFAAPSELFEPYYGMFMCITKDLCILTDTERKRPLTLVDMLYTWCIR